MTTATRANRYLMMATIIWGLTFPLIKLAVQYVNPSVFVLIRFAIAALCLLPIFIQDIRRSNRALLAAGVVLGTLNAGIYIFQTVSLQTISASRSAFITGANVLLVPFLLPLLKLGRPSMLDIIGAIICLVGLYVLTGAKSGHLAVGDFWALACTCCYAFSIAFVQWVTPQIKSHHLLTFYQILFSVPVAAIAAAGNSFAGFYHWQVLVCVLFCAVFATAVAISWQMQYQQHTTATKAALIFSLEPVFASLFAYFINGSVITYAKILGGSLILLSVSLPVIWHCLKRHK